MSFFLKKYAGYTEEEICDYIENYGVDWVYRAYKHAKDFEYRDRLWDLQVIQVAQTPQSKKGAKALEAYIKKLYTMLESQVPWRKKEIVKSKRTKSKPEPKVVIEGTGLPKEVLDFFSDIEDSGVTVEKHK